MAEMIRDSISPTSYGLDIQPTEDAPLVLVAAGRFGDTPFAPAHTAPVLLDLDAVDELIRLRAEARSQVARRPNGLTTGSGTTAAEPRTADRDE